ncbi:MAG: hypothetical protein WAW52_05235 [Methanothrix sp.]
MKGESLKQSALMDKMARAYELQEILKKERQLVRQHDDEYKALMDQITSSGPQKAGNYELTDKVVQRQHFIVSDKFREKWPDLFNQLATVKVKDAKEVIEEEDLETVWELKIITKPVVMLHNESENQA